MFKKIGPGALVAAAFIGPGTVTTCTLAGVSFGYSLLWAMLLAVISTVILQEMAARLGIVTQSGLADAIRQEVRSVWARNAVIGVVLVAIVFGNAAYEAGNIGGATLGMEAVFGPLLASYYPIIIGLAACSLLYFGNYQLMERILVALVFLMSLSFLITAYITQPNMQDIIMGLFIPRIPENGILTIMALVGTTVVPYNLFLHASLVSEKWKLKTDLPKARKDTIISISLGGLVSMAIMIAAASIPGKQVSSIMDLAKGLAPLYGTYATLLLGIGLFAAGLTSAITAPLAAAYVTSSCFGWKDGMKGKKFKMVWMSIIVLGVFFLYFEVNPIEIIKFAQVANGMLLPIIALFLLWAVNRVGLMGSFANTRTQNGIGILIVVLSIILGLKSVLSVFGIL